jgi:hypothetical protein
MQVQHFCLGIPVSKEPELPGLNFGQWQRATNVLLLMLVHDSYDSGNSFWPTFEEAHMMGTGREGAQAIHLNPP